VLAHLLNAIHYLGRFGGGFAALALAALTLLILAEISVRFLSDYVEGMPAGVPMAWEYSAYLMGIAFMAGAAMTLRAGSRIRVSILIAQLPATGKRVLEVIASFVGFLLTSFLAYSLTVFTWGSYTRGQTSISSDTPVWIPQAAITLGAALLALQMLARLLQALWGLPVEDPSLRAAAAITE
jgi:TRAP-type C4-dicarboxylate transport system permease small subunit